MPSDSDGSQDEGVTSADDVMKEGKSIEKSGQPGRWRGILGGIRGSELKKIRDNSIEEPPICFPLYKYEEEGVEVKRGDQIERIAGQKVDLGLAAGQIERVEMCTDQI